jgi:RNA polymerase sigma-70 factor (ECF subfamily)
LRPSREAAELGREAQGHPAQLAVQSAGGSATRQIGPLVAASANSGAAANDDAGSIDAWVLATLPRALAFAIGLVSDRDAAEDIVHDCYCRLLQKQDVYDLRQDGSKLLFRSITNACIDRSRRRSSVSLFAADAGDDEDSGRMIDVSDPRSPEPWERLDHAELQKAVSAGLEKLPPIQRAALELKSLGHSLQEIGEALNVSATNAGVLIHRARQTLAKHLEQRVET